VRTVVGYRLANCEQLRFHNIRDPVEAQELLQRPWAAELTLSEDVLELTFDNAPDHGLASAALVDDNWSACQAWSATFGEPSLIVPSAALPGTKNLVIFGPLVRSPYGIPPLDASVDGPCDPVADLSVVVTDLLRFVRWRGAAHDGYLAWESGASAPRPPSVEVNRAT
jgi:hypothetical protein